MDKVEILSELKKLKPLYERDGVIIEGIFGSYAKNAADSASDIDIAVRLREDFLQTHDAWAYFELLNAIKRDISKKFGVKCDVFDTGSTSPLVTNIKSEIAYV